MEQARLTGAAGRLELIRTTEIISRHLPPAPAVVADVGGGPGRYSVWLAEAGYRVHHRDIVPLHVEQATAATRHLPLVDTAVADAGALDLADGSVDAVLLLGPLYHLPRRADRIAALVEARRVVRPGGPVFVATISRWAARLHAVLAERIYDRIPGALDALRTSERTGVLQPLFEGGFTGNTHRPGQLRAEIAAAGLKCIDLVSVEGPAALLSDLGERLDDAVDAAVVLDIVRAVERIPEVIGVGPHLLATACAEGRSERGRPP